MSSISIVMISFNRPNEIRRNVLELVSQLSEDVEIVVVDNKSETPVRSVLKSYEARVKVIEMKENVGVYARNIGVQNATGDIVVTLDDDVFGFSECHAKILEKYFSENKKVAALNFRVIDDVTEAQINWCHRRRADTWGCQEFTTYEISEGAVAFRRQCFLDSGMYPSYFFISHEGPDMALSLMDQGWDVVYYPLITVRHAHSKGGRPDWRRYYYDTRNMVWLGVRRYNTKLFLRKVPLHLSAMFLYSLRDGFLRVYLNAIYDSLSQIKKVREDRKCISEETYKKYKKIEKFNPSLFYMIKRRLFKKGVSI